MRTTSLVGLLTGLALVATAPVATPAYAGTSTSSQTFPTDPAGWTATTSTDGLCVPSLLCPQATSTYAASGGSGGAADGYLRTSFLSLANTTLGTTHATWQSPAFAYDGVAGQQPTTVSVDLNRRAQLSPLLPVDLLNTSSFEVDLVDAATQQVVPAVETTTLPLDTAWTAVPTVHVNPALLTLGHRYALRVTTSYTSVATVTAAGEVGYDDVRVSASRTVSTTDPTNPVPPVVVVYPQTPGTPSVPAQTGITSTRELRQLVRTVGLPSTAKLKRDRVKLRVTCPAKASPRSCKYAVQGLRDGKGSPTTTNRVTKDVQPGQTRTVNLKVDRAYTGKYTKGAKITIRAKVRVGVFKVTVVKKVTLR